MIRSKQIKLNNNNRQEIPSIMSLREENYNRANNLNTNSRFQSDISISYADC